MPLDVSVNTSADTAIPRTKSEDRYNGAAHQNMIAGAVRVHTSDERDIWKVIKGRDIGELNASLFEERLFANSVDAVRQDITSRYASAPFGTYRVSDQCDLAYMDNSGHYKSRRTLYGIVVFKKAVIAKPTTFEEMTRLSVNAGTLMVPVDRKYSLIEDAVENDLYKGDKWDNPKRCFNQNGFSVQESGSFYRVRFNPQHFNRKVVRNKFDQDHARWAPLASGQLPHDMMDKLLGNIRPSRLSVHVEDKKLQRHLSRIKDTFGSYSEIYQFQGSMWFMKKMLGARFRGYRNDKAWKRTLEKAAPYVAGMRIKWGKFTDRKQAYLAYRRENPDEPACDVFDHLYEELQNGWFLQWLETELRAAKIKIPKLPPEPVMPPPPSKRKKGQKK